MVIVFVVLYSAVAVLVHDACRYPDYVQSPRDWRGHLPAAADGPATYSVSFSGRLMRVVAPGASFQRRCMLTVGNRTYLAAQRDVVVSADRAPRYRYVCMEFVRRGDAVLQLRTSRLASRMDPHLCAENQLFLDDRPLVDRGRRWRSADGSDCRLTGGYDVHLYDRRRRRGVCDALDAKTRLEVACADDDAAAGSFHFRFRYDFCVPSGLGMRIDEVTWCAATWTTDDDVFTVLVAPSDGDEDRLDAWCLRRPRRTFGRPFTAFLFRQLVCDDRPVANLTSAVMVDMQPSEDWGLSLCKDDYEGCAWDYPAVCARTADCARTCSVCNESVPASCRFRFALYGRWRSPHGRTSLRVNGSSLVLTSVDKTGRGRSTHYECVQWHRSSRSDGLLRFDDHAVDEHLVVTRPGNGCRPRYACVQLHYHTLSDVDRPPSVIHFRISASRPWPIYDRVDCASFRYVSAQSVDDEQQFTLMTSLSSNSTTGRNYVDCVSASLPVSTRFVVRFKNDYRRCVAQIKPASEPAGHFQLILGDCGDGDFVSDVRCLDRVTLSSENSVLLVTELSPFFFVVDADAVVCWLFTNISDAFYVLSTSDCDPLTSVDRLRRRIIRPVAVFVDALTITSSTVANTATFSVLTSPSTADTGDGLATVHGPSDDGPELYNSVMPANNGTSVVATATPTSRQQRHGSWAATPSQTRHDATPRQLSVAVDVKDKLDVGSRGHGDRGSHAGVTPLGHATDATTARTADTLICLATSLLLVICAPNR